MRFKKTQGFLSKTNYHLHKHLRESPKKSLGSLKCFLNAINIQHLHTCKYLFLDKT